MVATESVTINVPVEMAKYLVDNANPISELTRNAMILYPYIVNQTISHGYSYFDMTMDDLEMELDNYRAAKKKESAV